MKFLGSDSNSLAPPAFRNFARIARRNKVVLIALVVCALFLVSAVFADQMAPYDPMKISDDTFHPPSLRYPFGTDDLGRDIFSGVVYGARTSILIGVAVALLSGLIGVAVGAIAGYAGGTADDLLMRMTELFLIPPRFFLALIMAALFGTSMLTLIAVLAVTYWTTMARLVRALVLSLKERSFVEASRAAGARHARILFCTIMPHALPLIITNVMLMIGSVILLEAALDFIGIGDATRVSWGALLHNGQHFIRDAWWMIAFPGLALAAIVLAINILGDALNTALDPKAHFVNPDVPNR